MTSSRWIETATAAAAVALFVFAGALLWGFYQRAAITDRICAAQVDDRKALRAVVIGAEGIALSSPRVKTDMDEQRIRSLYEELLSLAPPLECVNGEPVERKP